MNPFYDPIEKIELIPQKIQSDNESFSITIPRKLIIKYGMKKGDVILILDKKNHIELFRQDEYFKDVKSK